jgi:pilus assembly protein Flp/PilA
MTSLIRFFQDEDGVTAVEYAVMLALILMACIVAVGTVGTETVELMDPGGALTGTLASGS